MNHLAVVACSGCGAGLPVRADQNAAVCRFCNASTPLENPVVQEARQSSAAVEATLAAGLKALLDALTRVFAPNAGIAIAMGLGCMVLGMTSVIPLFMGAVQCLKRADQFFYMLATFPLFPAAFFAFITIAQLYANHLPRLRASRRIVRLRAEFDLAPQPGNCPNCGGQCQIPGADATFDCVYCKTPLLAAAGMLVVWGKEASQQAEGWAAEAQRITKLLADRLRARIVAYVAGGFIFTFALLCSSAYYVLTVVLPGMDAIPCQLRLALPIVIEIPLIALLVLAVRVGWLDIFGKSPAKRVRKTPGPSSSALYKDGLAAFNAGDYTTALRLWRPLAEQGNVVVQRKLGSIYDKGQGVPQDYVQAHLWFNLAAKHEKANDGRAWATRNRDIVEGKMTPEQLAEARKLARTWKPVKR